jgi:hypothetical protein
MSTAAVTDTEHGLTKQLLPGLINARDDLGIMRINLPRSGFAAFSHRNVLVAPHARDFQAPLHLDLLPPSHSNPAIYRTFEGISEHGGASGSRPGSACNPGLGKVAL